MTHDMDSILWIIQEARYYSLYFKMFIKQYKPGKYTKMYLVKMLMLERMCGSLFCSLFTLMWMARPTLSKKQFVLGKYFGIYCKCQIFGISYPSTLLSVCQMSYAVLWFQKPAYHFVQNDTQYGFNHLK